MSTPQGFVVVGDTDWLSTSVRNVEFFTDSRLRAFSLNSSTAFRTGFCAGSRMPANGQALYFEWLTLGINSDKSGLIGGLAPASAASGLTAVYLGSTGDAVSYQGSGTIRFNGTPTTGLATLSVGSRLGVRLRNDAGTLKVQFYVDGAAQSSEVSLPAAVAYCIGASGFYSTDSSRLCVDADELEYLPAEAQPWGACARVADAGGYSREATSFTAVDSDYSLDTFRRTVAGAATSDGIAICDDAPNLARRAGIYYLEWVFEADTGTNGLLGLVPRGSAVTVAYPGALASGFGYYAEDGSTRNSASGASYGAAVSAGQRLGQIWEPSTGKLYWSINGVVQNAGDPESGTGSAFSSVTGDLVPAATAWQGRWRICTHAREQLYRPSYAEAWDGSDLLPEQHFVDRLAAVPSVRREVSYYPWANQRQRGAAIGALDLINADGMFDALSDYDLRDQPVIAYRTRSDGATVREFTALVDGVTQPAANRCRIALADMTAKLDVRVDSPVFALGSPYLIPSQSRIGSSISSDVAQSTFASFEVFDQALQVTTWDRSDVGDVSGFTRTVNPAGLQSVRNFALVPEVSEFALTNADFSAWTAGAPDGWTVYTVTNGGSAASVTQSGSTAVITAGDSGYAGVHQGLGTGALEVGKTYVVIVEVTAFTHGSGNYFIQLEDVAGSPQLGGQRESGSIKFVGNAGGVADEMSTGFVYFFFTPLTDALNGVGVYAGFGDSITISSVSVHEVGASSEADDAIQYLIETAAGQPASAWQYTAHRSPYAPGRIGYWTSSRPTVRAVLDMVCESLLLDYYTDEEGVIQFAWLVPADEPGPSEAEYAGELIESDVIGTVTMEDDYAPRLSTVAEYQHNYAQHNDGDIAGAVTASVRTYFTSEGRRNQLDTSGSLGSTDAGPLHPFYGFANGGAVMPRLVVNDFTDAKTPNNGLSSVDNRLIMLHRCYMRRRRFYRLQVRRESLDRLEYAPLRPGKVVDLTFGRYDLTVGKQLFVAAMEASLTSPTVSLLLWG